MTASQLLPPQNIRRQLEQSPAGNSESAVQVVNERLRVGHIAALWPLTSENEPRLINDQFVHFLASAYLAMEHFNARSTGAAAPELNSLLPYNCDFQLSMDIRDSRFNPFKAVSELVDSYSGKEAEQHVTPFAVLGPALSGETLATSTLSSALNMPQITGTATSTALDNVPLFARTIPTNQGDARAMMMYLQSIQVDKIGILYIRDPWGLSYFNALHDAALQHNIEIVVAESYNGNAGSLESSMRSLADSRLQYFAAIVNQDTWKPVYKMAYKYGVMGRKDRTWFLAEAHYLIDDNFSLDRETEYDLAQAIHGSGMLSLSITNEDRAFEQAMDTFMLANDFPNPFTNLTMRDRLVSDLAEPELFNQVAFKALNGNAYNRFMYDSVMALGMAACRTTPRNFTGTEFFEELIQTEFPGRCILILCRWICPASVGLGDEWNVVYWSTLLTLFSIFCTCRRVWMGGI